MLDIEARAIEAAFRVPREFVGREGGGSRQRKSRHPDSQNERSECLPTPHSRLSREKYEEGGDGYDGDDG